MRYLRTAAVLLASILTAACAARLTPVPIISDTGSSALLVGNWSGEYRSRVTGRSGSISFELASEKDTAYCDIVMVPTVHTLQVATRDRTEGPIAASGALAQPLRIRFIRLGGGRVSGTLDPYMDPECNCRVTTTFDGRITSADIIEGTYTTRGGGTSESTGTWKVNRQRTSFRSP